MSGNTLCNEFVNQKYLPSLTFSLHFFKQKAEEERRKNNEKKKENSKCLLIEFKGGDNL